MAPMTPKLTSQAVAAALGSADVAYADSPDKLVSAPLTSDWRVIRAESGSPHFEPQQLLPQMP